MVATKDRNTGSVLSAIIPTRESERTLVPTLASLVAGAADGVLREVIIADAGSKDATAEVADVAGCRLLTLPGPLGARLTAAAATARGPWLLFLRPGIALDESWVREAARFISANEAHGGGDPSAAVFRPGTAAGRPILVEALALLRVALGGSQRPEQGLMIAKRAYERLGGHRDHADTERDLLRRIGRRRIVILRAGAVAVPE
jgi:glycosyltransferase involved in cell wall biosynthesis